MAYSRRSVTDGSDEVVDCDICSKEEQIVDATSFCSDCPGNLCADCSKWHDKFPATKGHTVRNLQVSDARGYADAKRQGQRLHPPKPAPPLGPDYQELSSPDISRSTESDIGRRLEFLHEYNIALRDDEFKCKVYGTCLLADGILVLADNGNKRLIFLNRSTSVCRHYNLPCRPWGVCSTDLYEVAVTLTNEKRVQFVWVGKSIGMTRSFSVDQYCRGIAHHHGNLYVTCGSLNQPGSSFVGVFTLTGQPLHKIQDGPDGLPLFSVPHHVIVCDNGSRICVSDKTEGVFIVEKNGRVFKCSSVDLEQAFGICELDTGGILACGLNSDTIVQLNQNGGRVKTILAPADGLCGPYSLLLDQANATLIVTTYESGSVKVYMLK